MRRSLWERRSPSAAWGPGSLRRLGRWSPISWMSFTCSSRKSRGGVCAGRSPGLRSRRAWCGFFSVRRAASVASWASPTAAGTASARPGGGRGHRAASAFPGELGPSGFSSASSRNAVSRPREPLRRVEREARRRVGVGERQMLGTRRVTAASTRRSNGDECGSSCLVGSTELSSENGVGWSRRPRRAGWVIPRL